MKEWKALEDIGFKVQFKDDYIEVTRKQSWLDWFRLVIIIVFVTFLVASILYNTYSIGMLALLAPLIISLIYLQLRIYLFKLKFAPTIYEITELNYEYNKRQVPLNNIKDFIKVKGPFLAETHIYAIDYKNEMFKLLTTSSKYTKANEVLAALKNHLKENQ
mgnify:CR=1 FL=1